MPVKTFKKLFRKDRLEERIRKEAYNVLVECGMDEKRAKKLVENIKVVKLKKPIKIFGCESSRKSER